MTIASVAVLASLIAASFDAAPAAVAADGCVVPRQLGIVFVLDDSGSMANNDPTDLRGTATGIGLDQLPDGAFAATSTFDSLTRSVFGPTQLGGSRQSLKDQVQAALISSGGTIYEAAFVEAKRQLDAMPATVDRKAVVFLSDGDPNDPDFTADGSVGAPIFTVGFGGADDAVLASIAGRSGGQAYAIASAGEGQAVFARIVSTLTCDAAQIREDVELSPGETRTFPFAVGGSDREWRSLAAWSAGDVGVRILRPDGSAMTSDELGLRAGERFTAAPTYAQASAVNPATGGWALEVTAGADNVDNVSVSIDVFKRTSADPPDAFALLEPAPDATQREPAVTFSWSQARGADRYQLLVDGLPAAPDSAATSARVTLAPGRHRWQVHASNSFGQTPSETRIVTIEGTIGPGPITPWPSAVSRPVASAEAQAFMPLVFMDDDESWPVSNPDWFISVNAVKACDDKAKGCQSLTTGSFADRTRKTLDFDKDDHRSGAPPVVFVNQVDPGQTPDGGVRNGSAYRFLDYWWYSSYNDAPYGPLGGAYDHHSDWEGATVAVLPGRPTFDWAAISAHEAAWNYLPEVLRCGEGRSGEDRHTTGCTGKRRVNVYVADGTHAGYPRRCGQSFFGDWNPTKNVCDQTGLTKIKEVPIPAPPYRAPIYGNLPEGRYNGKGDRIANQPTSILRTLAVADSLAPNRDWVTWQGYWGPDFGSDPQSPAQQARYKDPLNGKRECTRRWASTNEANRAFPCTSDFSASGASARAAAAPSRGADPASSCDAWFGPWVAVSACDAQALAGALAAGTLGQPGAMRVQSGSGPVGTAPGLAQLAGDALHPGDSVRLAGLAGAALRVRAATRDGVVEYRFDATPAGTVTVRALPAGARATDARGRALRPARTTHLRLRRPATPRVRSVRRVRGRIVIRLATAQTRVAVEQLPRRGSTALRAQIVRVRRGLAIVPSNARARRVSVRAITTANVISRPALRPIR